MALNPKTGSIKELMSGIFFANGVAVSQGADFIAVVSTASWRVYRYWLNGPNVSIFMCHMLCHLLIGVVSFHTCNAAFG